MDRQFFFFLNGFSSEPSKNTDYEYDDGVLQMTHTTAAATGDVYTCGPSPGEEDARNNYCLSVFFAVVGTLLFFFMPVFVLFLRRPRDRNAHK